MIIYKYKYIYISIPKDLQAKEKMPMKLHNNKFF